MSLKNYLFYEFILFNLLQKIIQNLIDASAIVLSIDMQICTF